MDKEAHAAMTDAESPSTGPRDPASLNEKLTDPARIRAVLAGLKDNRALMSARISRLNGYCNTALLKLDLQGGYLYLDEFSPREAHEELVVGDPVHLYAVYNGIPAHFVCTIDHVGSQNDIAYYRAPIPEIMDYQQRRAHFRAYVGMGMDVSLTLRLHDGSPVMGRLQDISLGGFGALVPAGTPLDALDEIAVENLQLAGRNPITGQIQIRHVHPVQSQLHVGACFQKLDPRAERDLLKLILELEREHIRKQTR